MGKLESDLCLGCDSLVTFVRGTDGLYVARCFWCGVEMTRITNVRFTKPDPCTPGTGRHTAAAAHPSDAAAAAVAPLALRRPPRGAPSYG